MPQQRIAAEAERQRDASVAFLCDLIRLQRDGEAAVQRHIAAALRETGCEVEAIRYQPGDVPMVAEFATAEAQDGAERQGILGRQRGAGAGRSLIFFAHPDSEPVPDSPGWRHDPFVGTVSAGRLHGWGVADDLAGVAACVRALHLVRASGLRPAGDVFVASTPSKRHARGVSAMLHRGLSADAAVYLHPAESGAGMREVKTFMPGQLEFCITVAGRPPDTTEPLHTAFAHLAIDPFEKAAAIVRELRALGQRRAAAVRHPLLQAAVGRSTNLLLSHVAYGDPARLARVAAACTLAGALSFPPPETLDEVKAQVAAAVAAACAGDDWLRDHPPVLAWVSGVTGAEMPQSHPLWTTVAGAVRAVTHADPVANALHTASDIRHPMVQGGIPTVGLGPLCGDLSQNGGTDEWVDLQDYLRAVEVAARIAAAWCGTA